MACARGLRALREFCELQSPAPGLKLAPEDLWERCAYVLSHKMQEPQFSGQPGAAGLRQAAAFATSVARDAFSLWLNQHTAEGEALAELAIRSAQRRLQAVKKVARKRITAGPALPGKLADCSSDDLERGEPSSWRPAGARQSRPGIGACAVMPLRGKILNTWEVAPAEPARSARHCRGPWGRSGKPRSLRATLRLHLADADSMGSTLRPCFVLSSCVTSRPS